MPRKKWSLFSESLTDEGRQRVLRKSVTHTIKLLTRWNSGAAASPTRRWPARPTLRRDAAKHRRKSSLPTA